MRLSLFLLTILTVYVGQIFANQSKHWAVLLAGSNGWGNYRHQSDVAHAYRLMRANNILPENIITMMYDDVAWDHNNPFPGNLFQDYAHTDIYAGITVDYKGADVTVDNFLKVLKGDATMKAAGKKVLQSGHNDNVFIFMAGHGGVGKFCFPNKQHTLSQWTVNQQVAKVKPLVKDSTVSTYGDASVAALALSEFQSKGNSRMNISRLTEPYSNAVDTVSEDQVHLFQLERQLNVEQSPERLALARRRLHRATQLASLATETVAEIVELVRETATPSHPRTDIYDTLDCQNTIEEQFENKCFSTDQVPELAYELPKFYRLCERGYDANVVVQTIFDRCARIGTAYYQEKKSTYVKVSMEK
ncbi:unnamed protein product [Echinostoma caproni]|uniref:Legumain n=1 Tax=Echinostoma caproni TaxID=27848 RepID=A0A183AN42_9TREM|nr:unnamed protein product [Echinostoma caproni]